MVECNNPSHTLIDFHLHTSVTTDGRMSEAEACLKALSLGISQIAFTNHVMLNQPDYTISPSDLIGHWTNIQHCQEQFSHLTIYLGVEMDFYPGCDEEIASLLQKYEGSIGRPFDFVLGSVHELEGCFYSNKHLAAGFFESRDLLSLYNAYFEVATLAVKSGLFDVMAHPDLIKKYTHQLTPPLDFQAYRPAAEQFLDALISSRVGIEVNTKGLNLPVGETYPSHEVLHLYLEKLHALGMDPVITLGSDAHKAEDVGFKIAETTSWLHTLGINSLTCFARHKKSPIIL